MSTISAASTETVVESVVESSAAVPGVIEHLSGIGGAFTISIIAFSVVFLVLGGLSGVIFGIKYMAAALEKKKETPPPVGGGGGAPAVSASAPPAPARGSADGRLMAVLAAAVAASGVSGRIVGVSPAPGSRVRPASVIGWKGAAVAENMSPFGRDWK